LATGSRKSALLHARWSDIDLGNKLWTVPAELAKNREVNFIHLGKTAVRLFGEQKLAAGDSVWIFPSPRYSHKHLADEGPGWRKLKEAAGLDGLCVHDLRRTFGSRLASKGKSMKTIATLMNHKSTKVTELVYAHVSPAALYEALDSLE
jgi:integrase